MTLVPQHRPHRVSLPPSPQVVPRLPQGVLDAAEVGFRIEEREQLPPAVVVARGPEGRVRIQGGGAISERGGLPTRRRLGENPPGRSSSRDCPVRTTPRKIQSPPHRWES
uniref:Uncharacterized protein n=1 Tax=Pseudictyota dubia TaxID=2749911 RepID=A0A7R9W2C7_9STRA